MRNVIYLVVIFLLTASTNIYAQASWSYSIYFNLTDKRGNEITKDDILLSQKVRLYSGFQAHSNIEWDTACNSFRFGQGTIATTNSLTFIYNTDTTVFIIPTSKGALHLDTLTLTGNVYNMRNTDDAFDCTRMLPDYPNSTICKLRYKQEHYKTDEKFEQGSNHFCYPILPKKRGK